jgi:hypothetical protein
LSEIAHQTNQWQYRHLIPDVLYSDYRTAPLSGSAIFADTLPATEEDIVIPTGKEIQTPKVYEITCRIQRVVFVFVSRNREDLGLFIKRQLGLLVSVKPLYEKCK